MGVRAAAVAVHVRVCGGGGGGECSLVQLHKIKDFHSLAANSASVWVHSRGSGQAAGGEQ